MSGHRDTHWAEDRPIYTLQPMLNIVERKRQAV